MFLELKGKNRFWVSDDPIQKLIAKKTKFSLVAVKKCVKAYQPYVRLSKFNESMHAVRDDTEFKGNSIT